MGSILGPLAEGLLVSGPQLAAGYGAGKAQGEQARQRRQQQQQALQQRYLQMQLEQLYRQATGQYQQQMLGYREKELAAREKEPAERAKQGSIEFLRKQIAERPFELQESGQLEPLLQQLAELTGQSPIGRYMPPRQATAEQEAMMRLREQGLSGVMGQPAPGARREIPGRVIDVPRLAMPEADRAALLERQARTRYYGEQADAIGEREARLVEQFQMQHQLDLQKFGYARSKDQRDHLLALKRLQVERLRAATEQLAQASTGRLQQAQVEKILQEVSLLSQSLPPGVVARLRALEQHWKLRTDITGKQILLDDADAVRGREEYMRLLGLSERAANETIRTYLHGAGPDVPYEIVPPGAGSAGAGAPRPPSPGARGAAPPAPKGTSGRGPSSSYAPSPAYPRGSIGGPPVLPGPVIPGRGGTRIVPRGESPPRLLESPTGRYGALSPGKKKAAPASPGRLPSLKPHPSAGAALNRDLRLMRLLAAGAGDIDRVMAANRGNAKRYQELLRAYRTHFGKEYQPKRR